MIIQPIHHRLWSCALALLLMTVLAPVYGLDDPANETLSSGVVRIKALDNGKDSIGTGFVVRKDADAVWIVTAAHVVEGDDKPKVEFYQRQNNLVEAALINGDWDNSHGVALLKVERGFPEGVTALPLGDDLQKGDRDLVVIGHPLGVPKWDAILDASVSNTNGMYLTLRANIDEGNSGGPVFKDKRVAGLVIKKVKTAVGEAVPVSIIQGFLRGWNVKVTKAETTSMPPPKLPEAKSNANPKPDCVYCPEMVSIPAGEFMMGATPGEAEAEKDEQPRHLVKIKAFRIGKYEVTQGQWQAVMGSNPSYFKQCGDTCPVENVNFNDVQAFILKLNAKTGQTYRLPTEAEWEYAARAGTTTAFSTGDCITTRQANYNGNYDYNHCGAKTGVNLGKTAPVGSYPANPWGLYDMHGNVWEWTCSAYTEQYDGNESICINDAKDTRRVVRGGSWVGDPQYLRSGNRYWNDPAIYGLGFRLAQDL